MQETIQETQQKKPFSERWAEVSAGAWPWLRVLGAGIIALLRYILGCYWIEDAGNGLILVAGRISEKALLFATLYVTAEYIAHAFIQAILGAWIMNGLNSIALIAFSLLPEIILASAIKTTLEHWQRFNISRKWRNPAIIWAILYTILTVGFLVMTVATISGFVISESATGDPLLATGGWLVARCLAGWVYSLVSLIWATAGKHGLQAMLMGLRAQVAELQATVASQTKAMADQATEHQKAIELQATQHDQAIKSQATQFQKAMTDQATRLRAEATEKATALGIAQATINSQATQIESYARDLGDAQEKLRKREARAAAQAEQPPSAENVRTFPQAPTQDNYYRDRIIQAMRKQIADGQEIDYQAIARDLGIGYSTVRKYGPECKKELAS